MRELLSHKRNGTYNYNANACNNANTAKRNVGGKKTSQGEPSLRVTEKLCPAHTDRKMYGTFNYKGITRKKMAMAAKRLLIYRQLKIFTALTTFLL